VNERILIVEDETKIAALLRDYFEHAGYRVDLLDRGDVVEAFVAREAPALVVLDLQLPGKDGLEVCRALRARGSEPAILMLTARVDEIDRLLGLELGADDYVCKPFSPREVVMRARAILRRLQPQQSADGGLRVGPLELDRAGHVVRVAGVALALTPIEFELLCVLMAQPQRVFARSQLLERVGRPEFVAYERNIDGHVKNLRRKLRDALGGSDPIRSVYGVGYGLDAEVLSL